MLGYNKVCKDYLKINVTDLLVVFLLILFSYQPLTAYPDVFYDVNVTRQKAIPVGVDTISLSLSIIQNGNSLRLESGRYIQTVPLTIPYGITEIAIQGEGMGATVIDFISDVEGFNSSTTSPIIKALFQGFEMRMSAQSNTRKAFSLYGTTVNADQFSRVPSIIIRDVSVKGGDNLSDRFWREGIRIDGNNNEGSFGVLIDNFHYKGANHNHTDNYAIHLLSCLDPIVRGGYIHNVHTGIFANKSSSAWSGTEALTLDTPRIVGAEYAVKLGYKANAAQIIHPMFDYIGKSGIHDVEGSIGGHRINGGWFAYDFGDPPLDHAMIQLGSNDNIITGTLISGSLINHSGVGIKLIGNSNAVIGNRIRSIQTPWLDWGNLNQFFLNIKD